MASVALFCDRQGPLSRENWSQRELKIAKRAARKALDGVGDSATDTLEDGRTIIAIRRQCRDEERREVLEKFLSV